MGVIEFSEEQRAAKVIYAKSGYKWNHLVTSSVASGVDCTFVAYFEA